MRRFESSFLYEIKSSSVWDEVGSKDKDGVDDGFLVGNIVGF